MNRVEKIIRDENLHRTEGRVGVQNLARLCRSLGYFDKTYFGQFSATASYGDLINFLEDNNGAVEAIVQFMRENFDEGDEEEEHERKCLCPKCLGEKEEDPEEKDA